MTDYLVENIAKAISDEFWRLAASPLTWESQREDQRHVWRDCARAAIRKGQQIKATQQSQRTAA